MNLGMHLKIGICSKTSLDLPQDIQIDIFITSERIRLGNTDKYPKNLNC